MLPEQCPALLKSNRIGKEGREQENSWPGVDSTARCQWVLRDLGELHVQLEMHFLSRCPGRIYLLTWGKLLIMRWGWSSLRKEVLLTVTSSLCACLMETQTCVCVHVCVRSASAVHILCDSHTEGKVWLRTGLWRALWLFFFPPYRQLSCAWQDVIFICPFLGLCAYFSNNDDSVCFVVPPWSMYTLVRNNSMCVKLCNAFVACKDFSFCPT